MFTSRETQEETNVIVPLGLSHLKSLVQSARILVIKFHAEWCGPCKTTAPYYVNMANDLTSSTIRFVSIDIDKDHGNGGTWGEAFQINGVPCHKFYFDGEIRNDLTQMGADLKPVVSIVSQQNRIIANTTAV